MTDAEEWWDGLSPKQKNAVWCQMGKSLATSTCSAPFGGYTGNPWVDYHDSLRREDLLRRVRTGLTNDELPGLNEMEEVIDLAIEAHDAFSALEGGTMIEWGKLACAILELGGTKEDKSQIPEQLDQAYESLHFANGTAELAIKHRDAAEAVIEEIRQLVTTEHESKGAFIRRVLACLPVDPFPEND